jgi:hypothetical protein
MDKEGLIAQLKSKNGFMSILEDSLSSDSKSADIEKRYMLVEHQNADGTVGTTSVYYLFNTKTGEAKFYNIVPNSFDSRETSPDMVKQQALEAYLKAKYNAYFIGRTDFVNNWAEADVFTLTTGKLVKKKVLVYKQGVNPIADIDVV